MTFKDLKFHEASYDCSEGMKPFSYGNFGPVAVAYGIREACENPGKIVRFASVENSRNAKWNSEAVLRIFDFVVIDGELFETFGGTCQSKVASIASEDYGKPDVLSAVALDRIYRETEQLNFSLFSIFRLE